MGTYSARPRKDLGYFDLTELDTNCASAETAIFVTRDFVEEIILSIFNGYCVSNAVAYAKKKMFYRRFCQLSH